MENRELAVRDDFREGKKELGKKKKKPGKREVAG